MTLGILFAALLIGVSEKCPPPNAKPSDVAEYVEAVRTAGDIPVVVCRTARPEDLERVLSKLDLLILTGGEDVDPTRYGEKPQPQLGKVNAVRDAFDLDLLRTAQQMKLPIFGICRGAQILNVYYGGTLNQHVSNHRDVEHAILLAHDSRMRKICSQDSLVVNSRHHQSVKELAPGFRVAARAPDGTIEAIESDRYPVAGVQFHPESLVVRKKQPLWVEFFKHMKDTTDVSTH